MSEEVTKHSLEHSSEYLEPETDLSCRRILDQRCTVYYAVLYCTVLHYTITLTVWVSPADRSRGQEISSDSNLCPCAHPG